MLFQPLFVRDNAGGTQSFSAVGLAMTLSFLSASCASYLFTCGNGNCISTLFLVTTTTTVVIGQMKPTVDVSTVPRLPSNDDHY